MAYRVAKINFLANRDDVIYLLSVRLMVDIMDDLVEHFNANQLLGDTFKQLP